MIYRHLLPHIIVDAWVFAGLWIWRVTITALGLRHVPDLLESQWDAMPEGNPRLVVIVPARNEAGAIEAALRSLLAQDYRNLHILAVNDRSTDATPAIMERLAQERPDRLSVLHIEELPAGWLGKTHAMARAAQLVQQQFAPEYMLFTDGDILFAPDALRRSLVITVREDADHYVTLPTPIVKRVDESALLTFFQVMSFWAVRLWKVADPGARRDSIGVGAFALLKTSAYERLGGFEALRMEILEDLYLGRRVKELGMRQRVAFGRDLVRVHWAAGAMGVVGVLTKNMFSLFRFRLWLVIFVAFWLLVFSIGPIWALFIPQTRIPAVLIVLSIAFAYKLMSRYSGISWWNFLLSPLAGVLLVYSLLRSTFLTLRHGGVQWRGTFYSLRELRAQAGPLLPRRAKVSPAEAAK